MIIPTTKHPKANLEQSITANIIFNLGHLGLKVTDAKYMSLDTYFEIVELELKTLEKNNDTKRATQKDIDSFLL